MTGDPDAAAEPAPQQPDGRAEDDAPAGLQAPEAVNWLLLSRGSQLQIAPAAQAVFEAEPGQVNAVMVFGRLRTGKSYLLNALLGRSCFGVSAQAGSHTQGVDLCPVLLSGEHFGAPAGSPMVALLDTEGHGEKGLAQDVKLVTPLLLIAKAVIFVDVCPTGPSRELVLEALQVMMHAAQYVNRQGRRKLFGNLHIVLRDCAQDEGECQRILFDAESKDEANTDEHADTIAQRNDIRDAIKMAFESEPRVWCLPKLPTNEAPDDYRHALPLFREKVDEMRKGLGEQLARPKVLDEKPVTGILIAGLIPLIAEALRSDAPALNPPSLMQRVGEAEVRRAQRELEGQATKELDALGEQLPMHPSELSRRLESASERLLCDLDRRLEGVSAVQQGEAARAALKGKVELLAERLLRRDGESLAIRAKGLESDYVAEARRRFKVVAAERGEDEEIVRSRAEKVKAQLLEDLEPQLAVLPDPTADLVRAAVAAAAELLGERLAAEAARAAMRRAAAAADAAWRRQRRLLFAIFLAVTGCLATCAGAGQTAPRCGPPIVRTDLESSWRYWTLRPFCGGLLQDTLDSCRAHLGNSTCECGRAASEVAAAADDPDEAAAARLAEAHAAEAARQAEEAAARPPDPEGMDNLVYGSVVVAVLAVARGLAY